MTASGSKGSSGRVVFHCDGNEKVGAGHVGRCVHLAAAFRELGWQAAFVGEYGGLAAWLLERAGIAVEPLDPGAPCGVAVESCDAAVIDSYLIAPPEICELAALRPVVTLGEANRCTSRGIVVDYHLDVSDSSGPRLLSGPSFAPLDPAFAGAGRAGSEVRGVLVTLGGSQLGRELLARILPYVTAAFPEAEVLIAGPAPSATDGAGLQRATGLPSPSALVEVVGRVDLAVTAAGFTAYELACAGIPQVAVAIVANQQRVVRGLRGRDLAPCLDLPGGDSLAELPGTLDALRDPATRRELAERGIAAFDGRGALRAAGALSERFAGASGAHEGASSKRAGATS